MKFEQISDKDQEKYAILAKEIATAFKKGEILKKQDLELKKREITRWLKLPRFPSNSNILQFLDPIDREHLTPEHMDILRKKPSRTISGISVVAVMTPPAPCPGHCWYCPRGENAPQSYTGKEPAAMRGIQNEYDPLRQVQDRMRQLKSIGHAANKIHLVIQGGTFLALPTRDQESFIKGCLDGINGRKASNLKLAIDLADKTIGVSNVGTTFETRPDYCRKDHVQRILNLGGTWVEIGVQTLDEDVLRFVHRGHDVAAVKSAFRTARDAGLKITAHMMPNLFSTPERDVNMFELLYTDPDLKPDALKIYPCLVLEGTRLYEEWKAGRYQPYSETAIVDVLAKIKSITPPYVRIQRIQRDIPQYLIFYGVKHGNIREIVHEHMDRHGQKCLCIRCREIGLKMRKENVEPGTPELVIKNYNAAGSDEFFFSQEDRDQDIIFGFLRLRMPTEESLIPSPTDSGVIRELHVYGKELAIGKKPDTKYSWQHKGLGAELIRAAENTCLESGKKKLYVTSGLGTRNYYRKHGFKLESPYMVKVLNSN
ncbi:MAG: tRNA uridine(34) 5-carboxymethylaminomethyl modification radical SAM/GNAT enzyme Elp3 [Candidatus Hodarchaeales archaeon]|jgi:elongator complex protein 3